MLYNDLDPLRDIGIMQLYKAGDLSLGCVGLTAGIILNFLIDLVDLVLLPAQYAKADDQQNNQDP